MASDNDPEQRPGRNWCLANKTQFFSQSVPMLRQRYALSAVRKLSWPLRDPDTARHSIGIDSCGRLIMRIEPAELPGLTPEDIFWWFENIRGDVVIGTTSMSRYQAWHPKDHIHWTLSRPRPNGRAEVGACFHIVEALDRNMDFLVNVVEVVTRLDRTGITLEKRVLGQVVSRLIHDFGIGAGGASYHSTLIVGIETPQVFRFLNVVIRRFVFPEAMGRAWIRHNVEEVGLLEQLIPLLHDRPMLVGQSDTPSGTKLTTSVGVRNI